MLLFMLSFPGFVCQV